MDFDWKGLVKTVAPSIAGVFGGPLAQMGVRAVANAVLGPDAPADEEKIAESLAQANPEILLKLRQADHEFKVALQRAQIDLEKIAAEDRASARQREMALKDWTPSVLAFVITVGFFGVLSYLLRYGTPAHGGEAMLVMLGALGTAWTGVIAYYFGSSAGSKQKTDLLTKKN